MTYSTPRDLFPGALEILLQVEEGSLHPALQRLLKAELAKAEWGVSITNRRVRTCQITGAGVRRLEEQISNFGRMFEGIALVLNPGKSSVN
jgi:PadR family transcriptional regulator PadR